MDFSFNEIFRTVGMIVCWAVAVVLGFTIFCSIAGMIVAFASTGIGAVILAIVGWKLWKSYSSE